MKDTKALSPSPPISNHPKTTTNIKSTNKLPSQVQIYMARKKKFDEIRESCQKDKELEP